ncbi:MAG: penicillin-binding protein 2 [Burkholderiales bacterium]|nr:penicillin-binding protein 2 [Burkholderiales bacterium]
MSPDRHPQLSLRLPVWRTRFVVVLLLAGFGGLAGRAAWLQGFDSGFLQRKGERAAVENRTIPAHRGTIVDRNGEVLAKSTPLLSVAADPSRATLSDAQRTALAPLLGVPRAELDRKLPFVAAPADHETRRSGFVWLRRQLEPEVGQQVQKLGLPGITVEPEFRRYYPAADVTAHLVGFTDLDDHGQEGLELAYQDWLSGHPGSRRVVKDRKGHAIEDVAAVRAPQQGRDLALSIDLKLQYLAWRELRAAVTANKARAGGVVVLDARTGEVLAMANTPTFNPNNRNDGDPEHRRNRTMVDLFEPGSTIKPFTIAAAVDRGLISPATRIATSGGVITVGNRTIRDAHAPPGDLTVEEVIQRSSNVGTVRIAQRLGAHALWQVLSGAGLGSAPRSGFPGEIGGRLRDPARWLPIEQATISYGQGMAVSLMQLSRAYTVFCNDGALLPVTLVRRDTPVAGVPVISASTAEAMRRMLQLVTQPGGTATRAQVPGFSVGGKTGTAYKVVNGRYASNRYIASFVGFAPATAPRLVVAVMIDEPSAGEHYGGQVAAPVFAKVMGGALRMLGVAPDDASLKSAGPVAPTLPPFVAPDAAPRLVSTRAEGA